MQILYNLFIRLYLFCIIIAGMFNKKARLWLAGRKNLFNKISFVLKEGEKRVWFHCSSLGEFEQGRPVIEKFREKYAGYKIVLTFFSPSGYEIRKNYEYADYIFYLPLDTRKNSEKFIELINPKLVFFIKYEYWFNFLSVLKQRNIPVFIVSAIFRSNQHFFKWYGAWFRKKLKCITYFFVQNKISKGLLESIGITNVSVSGDTRFDRVFSIANNKKSFPLIEKFKGNNNLLIAGSTWPQDEKLIYEIINLKIQNLKFVIVPHEVHKEHINGILHGTGAKAVKFSEADDNNVSGFDALIVDSIGVLSHLYQYSTVTYIGGGFSKGIHNILEAATFGNPVVFGPNYFKFHEAKDLIEIKGAFSVSSSQQLADKLRELLDNKSLLEKTSAIAKNYVAEKKGATENVVKEIEKYL